MASKRFLLVALAFATVLLVVSEIASAKELASNHETGEVADAKYHHDDHGYYNGGRGGYNNGGRGGYNNGGGHGGYNNGGGYNHGGGRGGGYCRHGCCGRYYNGGCNCCQTLEEATAYKQAQETQTHN